ncbi:hypothetical protein L0Y46_00905 [bacterium]|nr:hypothetical protein [bacterium]
MEKFTPDAFENQQPTEVLTNSDRPPRSSLPALAFVAALQLSGCATPHWAEKMNLTREEPVNSHELSLLLEGPRNEALYGTQEKLYIYGIGRDGNPVIVSSEACATGTEFGVSGSSILASVCTEQLGTLESREDVQNIGHAHTHPSASATRLDEVTLADVENLSQRDLEGIRQNEKWHAFPPSFQDLAGLGLLSASDVVAFEGKKLSKRVVDASGVWTYEVNPDHPAFRTILDYIDTMADVALQAIEELKLEEREKQEFVGLVQSQSIEPDSFIGSDNVREAYRSVLDARQKKEEEFKKKSQDTGLAALIEEWETRQFDLATRPAESREELLGRINEFIEFAAGNGVRLSYEPFER